MQAEDATEQIEEAAASPRGRRIAIFISCLAVLLAISSLGGGNATKDVINHNIAATDLYAFYQAKNIRQTMVAGFTADLELLLKRQPGLHTDLRAEVEARIRANKAAIARFESNPAKNEGKRELLKRARAAEEARDIAQRRDPYFDYSQAFLQIAIVLASVSLIAVSSLPLWLSIALGGLGTLLLVNGFTLVVQVGFLE